MKLDLELYRKEVFLSKELGVRLSVIDVRPVEAEQTIVFLHGFGGKATQWQHQLRHFSDAYRVVAPDMRGHGASNAPHSDYTVDELIADFQQVLEAVDVPERFVLAAHSFGGAIAMTYAAAHPERVEKLILVGCSTDYRLTPLISFTFRLPVSVLNVIRAVLSRAFFAPAHVLKKMYNRAMSVWNGQAVLGEISVPTLVIAGHRDLVFPHASAQELTAGIPRAQSVTIPVSSHLVQLERPDATNRAMDRFLEPAPLSWRERKEQRRLTQERPWLKHYEIGVPRMLGFPDQPLHRFLESAARRHPSRPALIFYGRRISYRRLDELANRFAHALHEIGVRSGDRVMLLLPNSPQSVIAYYGALKAGAVVVLGNPLSHEAELAHQIADAEAETLVALSLFYHAVRSVKEQTGLKHIVVTNVKEYLPPIKRIVFTLRKEQQEGHRIDVAGEPGVYWWDELLANAPATPPDVEACCDDLATILYTSGTTDLPRGVMLSHANLVANAIQIRHWVTDAREGREVLLAVLPFSHSYGMTACMNASVCLAAAMVLLPTFETKEVLKTIRRYRPTLFPGVPTMYTAINDFPGVRRYGLSSIRACISGAAPLPVEVQEAFEKLTRGRLVEGYGLTEASPVTHGNPLGGQRKVGSIGIPFPSTEARIVDMDTGQELPPGEIGELAVRGPQVMIGYWQRPQETAQVLRDGWLYTGDVASMDEDGYFQIISRKKDMILAGQYNVYPRDVEEVLYEHPKVLEAAVVGIPYGPAQEQALERFIKAFVVLKHGEQATEDEIRRLCQERLQEYAVPSRIEFRAELPKSMVGKVLRRILAEGEERAT